MSNSTNSFNNNYKLQKTILICGMISTSIIIILLVFIVIYCIIKSIKDRNKINNKNIFVESTSKNTNNENIQDFKSVANSSTIGNESGNHNLSLSEIKEKNLKDEIHNIIHSANSNSNSDERRKRKRKNGKKSSRSTDDDDISPRKDSKGNEEKISTKKLENDIKNQIKQFVRENDDVEIK
ncbi:MAG: hypothetical protein II432_06860 [Erysipelotrichaceae bacterium]|nr:hypothetical protein [Erysipelotrichaceae bacterium]